MAEPEPTPEILNYSDVARLLGVHRVTVSDLARCRKLKPKPVRRVGGGLGLDRRDLAVIRRALYGASAR